MGFDILFGREDSGLLVMELIFPGFFLTELVVGGVTHSLEVPCRVVATVTGQ